MGHVKKPEVNCNVSTRDIVGVPPNLTLICLGIGAAENATNDCKNE